MALSEREQQMLEQLEKQFKEDDPQFAQTMETDPGPSSSNRSVVGGVLMTVAGFVLLLFGLALQNPAANLIIGLTGFATMVTGLYLATKSLSAKQAPGLKKTKTTGGTTATPKQASKETFSNAAWWALLFWWV
ncbi:hypothetical protein QF038_004136 [Pseudarthrobacter sp. W1I19]|uniref:DUF3040 domain-containing protein n=1 Tax=Pseudarthrobacter sp. W1I19 TaxID=3042288 RepID=UPI002787016B|nr:DUF3040 domain-containing protein [Pseudarthrobacter sp. W1I19]MDQ0925628.1 hypothetical protein [Pseudarthrobacter sp. W1I19]